METAHNINTKRSTDSETRKTIRRILIAQPFGAIPNQLLLSGGVLSLLILHLGGSNFEIGAVFACQAVAQIARLLIAPHVDVADRKHMFLCWGTISAVFTGAFLLAPFVQTLFNMRAAIWWVIFVFFCKMAFMNAAAVSWHSLLCDIVPSGLRGRFFGRMRSIFQACSFVAILLCGWYLGKEPDSRHFYMVLAAIFAIGIIRPLLMLKLPRPPPSRKGPPTKLLKNMLIPLHDREFVVYMIFWVVLAVTGSIARPFVVPFLKNGLGFPSDYMVYTTAGMLLGMVLGFEHWGKIVDRFGNRVVLLNGTVLLAVAVLLVCTIPDYSTHPVLSIALSSLYFFLSGLATSSLGMGQTVRTLHAAPDEFRGAYIGTFFTVTGITAGITSSIAGRVLDLLPGTVSIGTVHVLTLRFYFPCIALLILATLPLLKKTVPVSEKPFREALSGFAETFPSPLLSTLRFLNRFKP